MRSHMRFILIMAVMICGLLSCGDIPVNVNYEYKHGGIEFTVDVRKDNDENGINKYYIMMKSLSQAKGKNPEFLEYFISAAKNDKNTQKLNESQFPPSVIKFKEEYDSNLEIFTGKIPLNETNEEINAEMIKYFEEGKNINRLTKIYLTGKLFGEKQKIATLVLYGEKNSNEYRYFYSEPEIMLEFFKGEMRIFNEYLPDEVMKSKLGSAYDSYASNIKYQLKCAILLRELLFYEYDGTNRTTLEAVYNKAVNKYFSKYPSIDYSNYDFKNLSDGLITISEIPGGIIRKIIHKNYNDSIDEFNKRLNEHFRAAYINIGRPENKESKYLLPIFQMKENNFVNFYGELQERTPYLNIYLQFLFESEGSKSSKPLYSLLLSMGMKNQKLPENYDYRQYRKLTEAEGNQLAQNALKYLTWGVEYTPNTVIDNVSVSSTANRVYKDNLKAIKQWIKDEPLESATRVEGKIENNYFPPLKDDNNPFPLLANNISQQNDSYIPTSTHIFDVGTTELNDKVINIAGYFVPNYNGTYSISKVDLWSARNIVWDEGRVSQIIVNGKMEAGNGSGKSIFDKNRMTNRIISKSANKISLGYQFMNKEKVKSLCVVGAFEGSAKYKTKINVINNGALVTYTPGVGNEINELNYLKDKDDAEIDKYVTCSNSRKTEFDDNNKHYSVHTKYLFDEIINNPYQYYDSGIDKADEKQTKPEIVIKLKEKKYIDNIWIRWIRGKNVTYSVYVTKIDNGKESEVKVFSSEMAFSLAGGGKYKDLEHVVESEIIKIRIKVDSSLEGVGIMEMMAIKKMKSFMEIMQNGDGTYEVAGLGRQPVNLLQSGMFREVYVSSTYQTYYKEKLYDGDCMKSDKAWSSDVNNQLQYITVDLGKAYDVNNIEIWFWRGTNARYKVWVSDTNIGQNPEREQIKSSALWGDPLFEGSYTWIAGQNKLEDRRTLNTNNIVGFVTRSVRFLNIEVQSDNGFSVGEINIKGKEPPSVALPKDVKYRYYMFPQEINAEVVEIEYDGLEKITVEELLVFSENPIAYAYSFDPKDKSVVLKAHCSEIYNTGKQSMGNIPMLCFNNNINSGTVLSGNGSAKGNLIYRDPGVYKDLAKNKQDALGTLRQNEYLEIYEKTTLPNAQVPAEKNGTEEVWGRVKGRTSGQFGYCRLSRKVVSTGNKYEYVSVNNSKFILTIKTLEWMNVKTIVIWDTPTSTGLSSELMVFHGSNDYLCDIFLHDADMLWEGKVSEKIGKLSSPFEKDILDEKNEVIRRDDCLGNPLPYTPMGIDSPRTFAFKMYQQDQTRRDMRNIGEIEKRRYIESGLTTRAADPLNDNHENYGSYYVREDRWLNVAKGKRVVIDASNPLIYNNYDTSNATDGVKPFLPGNYTSACNSGYNDDPASPYHPDKSAGVSSIGLLMGAAAMSKISIIDIYNQNVTKNLDKYYAFLENSGAKGTDGKGKPVFFTGDGNSTLGGNYRLTAVDLEKSTVIVPDISQIQVGDLLINNGITEGGEPHIGIVVALGWDSPPVYGSAVDGTYKNNSRYCDLVFVISVRPGFTCINLGTWGNPGGMFGGFAENPKDYQIRRLLTRDIWNEQNPVFTSFEGDRWERVTGIMSSRYENYPGATQVPEKEFIDDQKEPDPKKRDISLKRAIDFIKGKGIRYFQHLPSTKFRERNAESLYRIQSQGDQKKMPVTNYTGYRQVPNFVASFHMAIDIGRTSQQDEVIYAPENGIFYYMNNEKEEIPSDIRYKIEITPGERIDQDYRDLTYGNPIVLITNPEDPRKGRIYVFCHVGEKNNDTHANESWEKTVDKNWKFLKDSPEYGSNVNFPENYQNALQVQRGWPLGYVGRKGEISNINAYHVHLEVWEWFESCDDVKRTEGYYRRINPITLFPNNDFTHDKDNWEEFEERIETEKIMSESEMNKFLDYYLKLQWTYPDTGMQYTGK